MRWTERQRAMLAEMGLHVAAEPRQPESGSGHRPAESAAAVAASDQHQATAIQTARVAGATASHRPDIAALDWTELRQAVVNCTACSLCKGRKQTVFGVGNLRAHWMIVGEAPGQQEDIEGEPFVGKSGQLLDKMLSAIGLSRHEPATGAADPARQVFIANTLKCRPPGNRNPEPEELAQCEPFLIRQIELVEPRIILAMGRFAVQRLLRSDEPIGRLRGRVHRYQGVPLIVTYHPAYLLRNLEDKARAWDDLCLALETAEAATGRMALTNPSA